MTLSRSMSRTLRALLVVASLTSSYAAAREKGAFVLESADLPPSGRWPGEMMLAGGGCAGRDVSPELHWRGAPPGTKSFAVTMYDPYRPPQSGWWHWIVYDIPAAASRLPRGAGSMVNAASLPRGAHQGLPDGDASAPRYYGPCPDRGDRPHPYRITVHALKVAKLDVPPSATAAFVDYVIAANAIAKASIVRPLAR